jgi:hypothetical protein
MRIVMHYFRKRQTRPASTKSAPLIYEDNRTFLEGKREKLAWPNEAYENLEASIGLTRPSGGAGCAGCATGFGLIVGMMIIAVGALISVSAVGLLLQSRHSPSDMALTILLLLSGIAALLVFGPPFIIGPYLAEQSRIYLQGLYNRLIAHGQIVEGTITSVESIKIEKVVTPRVILCYRFTVPGQSGDCEGQYKTVSNKDFAPEQKVTVLYLSRFIQVLL